MTAVQAVVAMGTFALSVLAPQLGVDVQALGMLGSVLFSIGALSSLAAGWLIRRLGDLQLAAYCMLAVMLAMLCLTGDAMGLGPPRWSLWPAVFLLGLAFGPETPASASVLVRVTPLARRPWIFSVRQTGNQIGAMAGSLVLPILWVQHAAWLGLCVALWCMSLVQRHGTSAATSASIGSTPISGLVAVLASPQLRLLTITMLVYMSTQVCLNLFLMSHAVHQWQLPIAIAGGWVALMQAAGMAGRLLWGRVIQQSGFSTMLLLGGLGLMMGTSGLLLFLWPATPPSTALAVLLILMGLSASGWNGVMVAELARVAGPQSAGAVTGAVLLFGYSGLALAPLCFCVVGAALGTSAAFIGLLTLACIMGAGVLLRRC